MNIIFSFDSYKKLFTYIDSVDAEISGFGKVKKNGNSFYVEEIKIFNQVVTGTETTINKSSLGKFFDDLVSQGEELSDWRLWWHSHNDFEAYFSSIDAATIEDFDIETKEDNWMLSVVGNKMRSLKCRVDVYQPIRCTTEVSWAIDTTDIELQKQIAEEVSLKIIKVEKEKKLYKRDPYILHSLYPDVYDEFGNLIIQGEIL